MGYRGMLNAHAKACLPQVPDIPDCNLMVGSAELLAPLPVILYKNAIPPQAIVAAKNLKDLTHEEVVAGMHAGVLSIDDFPSTSYYLGNPVEVF